MKQKIDRHVAKAVWSIREAVHSIILFSKIHPVMRFFDTAKKSFKRRYWEPLRKALIGCDTVEVRALMEKCIAYSARFTSAKDRLRDEELYLGIEPLPYYTIENCWKRLDYYQMSFPQKIRLSKTTHISINSEMNKKLAFIKIKRILGKECEKDTELKGYIETHPFFADYEDYDEYRKADDYQIGVPSFKLLTERVWNMLTPEQYLYWINGYH